MLVLGEDQIYRFTAEAETSATALPFLSFFKDMCETIFVNSVVFFLIDWQLVLNMQSCASLQKLFGIT